MIRYKLYVLISLFVFILSSCSEEITDQNTQNQSPDSYTSFELVFPANYSVEVESQAGTLTFLWNYNKTEVGLRYDVYLDNNSNPTTLVASDLQVSEFTIQDDLNLNSNYYWKIRVHNPDGTSFTSQTYVFSSDNGMSLSQLPQNDSTQLNQNEFKWKTSSKLTATYEFDILISRYKYFDSFEKESAGELNTKTVNISTIKGIEFNTQYYWKVRGTDKADSSNVIESETLSFVTEKATSLQSPSNLSEATLIANPQFTWLLPSSFDDTSRSVLYLGESKEALNVVINDIVGENYTYGSELEFAKTYYWKVISTLGTINSESEIQSFTTEKGLEVISPQLSTSNASIQQLNFEWRLSQTMQGATTYIYFDSTRNNLISNTPAASSQIQTSSAVNFLYDLTSTTLLDYNKEYYWKIVSTKDTRIVASEIGTVKTEDRIRLLSPQLNDLYKFSFEELTFNWEISDTFNAESFTLILDTDDKFTNPVEYNTVNLFYTLTTLNVNTTYYWKIKAKEGSQEYTSAVHTFTTEMLLNATQPVPSSTDNRISEFEFHWYVHPSISGASFDLYLGTVNDAAQLQKIADGILGTSYNYSATNDQFLDFGAQYFWMVTGIKDGRSYESSIHSFTTKHANLSIHGYVNEHMGGPSVENAAISLRSPKGTKIFAQTTSDSVGYFNLQTIEGEFSIYAEKMGRASSKYISYFDANAPMVFMQEFPLNTQTRSAVPPHISVDGLQYGSNIADGVNISIKIGADNFLEPSGYRYSVSASIDNLGSFVHVFSSTTRSETSATATLTLPADFLPRSTSYLRFIAYDNNNNQGILVVPVKSNKVEVPNMYGLRRPGTSESSAVIISANTVGQNLPLYTLEKNTTAYVLIQAATDEYDGLIIYRGLNESSLKYIGTTQSSRSVTEDITQSYFYFVDSSPELQTNTDYIYKLKYFRKDQEQGITETSDYSAAFYVPILNRYQLSLKSPSNHTILSNPNAIAFTWGVDSSVNFVLSTSYYSPNVLKRIDTLYVSEVGTYATIYSNTLEKLGTNAGTGNYTHIFDLNALAYPLSGKYMFWEIRSQILFEVKKAEAGKYYIIKSSSTPTIDSYQTGRAQDGIFYFTVE